MSKPAEETTETHFDHLSFADLKAMHDFLELEIKISNEIAGRCWADPSALAALLLVKNEMNRRLGLSKTTQDVE